MAFNPEVDIDELMTKIRNEVVRKQQSNGRNGDLQLNPLPSKNNLSKLDSHLNSARQYAHVGTVIPSFEWYPVPLNIIARIIARFITFFLSFITNIQKHFNNATIQIFQMLFYEIERLENEILERDNQIANQLQQQQRTIQRLENELLQIKSNGVSRDSSSHNNS